LFDGNLQVKFWASWSPSEVYIDLPHAFAFVAGIEAQIHELREFVIENSDEDNIGKESFTEISLGWKAVKEMGVYLSDIFKLKGPSIREIFVYQRMCAPRREAEFDISFTATKEREEKRRMREYSKKEKATIGRSLPINPGDPGKSQ